VGADSSESQQQGTPASHLEISRPPEARNNDSIADYSYIDKDGWRARGTLGYSTEGGLYLQSLTFEPPPGGRITAKMLRELPLTDIVAKARSAEIIANALHEAQAEMVPEKPTGATGPGRTPLSEDLLREVALGYLDQTAPGMGRGAVKRLAERMGVDQKTMSRYVFRARQTGWLGPAIQGREGSEPGPKLIAESSQPRSRLHVQRGVGGHPRPQSLKTTEQPDEPGVG
jgi:hypothetical protein